MCFGGGGFPDVLGPISDAFKKPLNDIIDGLKKIANDLGFSDLEAFARQVAKLIADAFGKAIDEIMPKTTAEWVSLIVTVIKIIVASGNNTAMSNLKTAVQSGSLKDITDQTSPFVADKIVSTRGEVRNSPTLSGLPATILDAIKDTKIRSFAGDVRWVNINVVDDKDFLYVWKYFLGEKTAIPLIDTIVFVDDPDFNQADVRFATFHQIFHLLQYEGKIPKDVVREYMIQKSAGDGPTKFELDADQFAESIVNPPAP